MTLAKRKAKGKPLAGSFKYYPNNPSEVALRNAHMAICSRCKMGLDLDKFYKNPYNKIGRDYDCINCRSEYRKKKYRERLIAKKLISKGKSNDNSQTEKENRGN